MGAGGRLRARRLGQHGQLHQADRHVRAVRQVLPVPQAAGAGGRAVTGAVAAPLERRLEARQRAPRHPHTVSRGRRVACLLISRFWSPCNIQASSSPSPTRVVELDQQQSHARPPARSPSSLPSEDLTSRCFRTTPPASDRSVRRHWCRFVFCLACHQY